MFRLSKLAQQCKAVKYGGYCQLENGDRIADTYVVRDYLGRGRFSTVWAAEAPGGATVAIKVYRSGEDNERYFNNEVMIFNKINLYAKEHAATARHLVKYLGFFTHSALDFELAPIIYPCVAFSLAGDHLGRLLRHYSEVYGCGLPMSAVKRFMAQILSGLSFLHKCGIVHTDIKPSNILMNVRAEESDNLDAIELQLADIGSASFVGKIFSRTVGTEGYLAPEMILGLDFGPPADVWAAFTVCYEMYTSEYLFDVRDEDKINYGADVNEELASTSPTDGSSSDSSSSDDDETIINYKHFLLFEKLLGPAPKEFTRMGRDYYNAKGRLKWNPSINHSSLAELLRNNYDGLTEQLINEFSSFLYLGLRYLPDERITAEAALGHPFLSTAE